MNITIPLDQARQVLKALNSFPHRHLTPFILDTRNTFRQALAAPEDSSVVQPTEQPEYRGAVEVSIVYHEGQRMFAVPKQPAPVQEPTAKHTDPFESARVGDYNRGWNDCLFASGIVKQPAPVREDWGPGPHESHSLPVPVHPDSVRIDWLTNNPVDALDIFGRVKGADAVRWIRQEIDSAIKGNT